MCDHYSVLPLCFYASAHLQTHLQVFMSQEIPLVGISGLNYTQQRKITRYHRINDTELTVKSVKKKQPNILGGCSASSYTEN